MTQRLLITGFDPFGNAPLNPSWMAVEQLPDKIGNFVLCKLQIPTVFGKAAQAVLDTAKVFDPHVILCIGLAGGRSAVTPERIAVNIRDARISDNEGNQPLGQFVVDDGPAAYFATVPVEKMVSAICEAQLSGAPSNSAGTFVCNDTLYTLLHYYAGSNTRVGFIHVPNVPELGEPSMTLANISAALSAAITACDL